MQLTRRTWAAIVIVVALTATAATAVANHVFPDSTGGFHDQIANVATAGCATGFTDGTFRPQDPTTRGQFAAWMNRCGGRTTDTVGGGTTVEEPSTITDLGTFVQIASGATGDLATGGFVHVTASVTARVNDPDVAQCPCFVQARLDDRTADEQGPFASSIVPLGNNDVEDGVTNLALTETFEIGPDEVKEFGVEAIFIDDNVASVSFSVRLNAVYVPFGPDGDDTTAFEP